MEIEIKIKDIVEWFKTKGLSDTSIRNYSFYYNKFEFIKISKKYDHAY